MKQKLSPAGSAVFIQAHALSIEDQRLLARLLQGTVKEAKHGQATHSAPTWEWFNALRTELINQTQLEFASWGVFEITQRTLADALAAAVEVLEHQLTLLKLTKIERVALRRVVARLVVAAARQWQSPLGLWQRVVYTLDRAPELVENAYPGYIASGLLRHLFKQPT